MCPVMPKGIILIADKGLKIVCRPKSEWITRNRTLLTYYKCKKKNKKNISSKSAPESNFSVLEKQGSAGRLCQKYTRMINHRM